LAEGGAFCSPFDCVVIIRGGGATADLSGFDTLALAENVAQFPLPIITGIGHDRDECVLDMVSHLRVKTPTAAAAFLIDHAQQVLDRIDDCQQRITHSAQFTISNLKARISNLETRIPTLFSLVKTRQEAKTEHLLQRIGKACDAQLIRSEARLTTLNTQISNLKTQIIESQRHRLELLSQRIAPLDPQLILNRGYSITLHQGKAVTEASVLKTGEEIETRLAKGTVTSIIK
jgi:exodeoxyribonuclease VII large subunit